MIGISRISCGSRAGFLATSILLPIAACDSTTEPAPEPVLTAINTIAIRARGAVELDTIVPAIAGFQFVDGEGTGVHIAGLIGGRSRVRPAGFPTLPWAPAIGIQLPGRPEVGTVALGRWDPLRAGEIIGGAWVNRTPTVSFGARAAAVLGFYGSLPGGTVEIESVTLPTYRDLESPASIRGRLDTRVASDDLLASLGNASVEPGHADVVAEFWVELHGWHTGRAAVSFVDGALAGVSSAQLTGSASAFIIGADDDERLVISITDDLTSSGPIQLWLGTTLNEAGTAALRPVGPDEIHDPDRWPDQFVAGTIRGADVGSVSGVMDLVAYEPGTSERWGEVMGRVHVELAVRGFQGAETLDHTTGEITFRVPVRGLVHMAGNE